MFVPVFSSTLARLVRESARCMAPFNQLAPRGSFGVVDAYSILLTGKGCVDCRGRMDLFFLPPLVASASRQRNETHYYDSWSNLLATLTKRVFPQPTSCTE